MVFPYFFTIRDGADKIRVEHLMNNMFEFHIQFENGITDQFIYNVDADEIERQQLWKGNLSRYHAIQAFDNHLKEDKHWFK